MMKNTPGFFLFLAIVFLSFDTSLAQNAPIEITADMLEVERDAGIATFSGSVRASQQGFRLNADKLKVFYAENSEGATEIKRLEASGEVFFDNAQGQSARAQWAVFDVEQNFVTLGDKVQLLQGDNIIEGGKTVMNLNTGQAQMTSAEGDRVRGLFLSNNQIRLSEPQ
ncbi:MAG: lipopolysaccharide transport periplasmic protein LptA [Hyphomicrobiales bacterium]|nr:lipopolysaccharide transport periplasmic protein LptA [Hyphomicrobiales bacterium]MCY4038881.1 lipopolysaccharide transport periplasmic protein LptA [Hyphomicrobiales bacterium]